MNPLYLSNPSIAAHIAAPENPLVSLDSTTCTAAYSSRTGNKYGQQLQGPGRSAVVSCDSLLWDTGEQDLQQVGASQTYRIPLILLPLVVH